MLSKRIIPCLDVRDGKLTKGIKFKGNVDIGDPVERGDVIGLSGNTGRSMMPHLHFQVDVPEIYTECLDMECDVGQGCGRWGCSRNASTEVAFADVWGDGIPTMGWTYTSMNERPGTDPVSHSRSRH